MGAGAKKANFDEKDEKPTFLESNRKLALELIEKEKNIMFENQMDIYYNEKAMAEVDKKLNYEIALKSAYLTDFENAKIDNENL